MGQPSRAPTVGALDELEAVGCALCEADDYAVLDRQRGFRIVECRQCGLVYLNPRPSPEWLRRSYQEYLPAASEDIVRWNHMMDGLYRSARRRLIGRFPAAGRLLDVGCAYGRFLEIMRDAGWQVAGLEVCEPAAAACRRNGLDVETTTLAGAALPPLHYDCVTMFYVLEHLHDPLGELRKVHEALKPDGVCLVRVPDTTPLVRVLKRLGRQSELYDPPYHLFDYSPAVLARMFREAGFENIRVEIDAATRPVRWRQRVVSITSSFAGRVLQRLTGGRFLLPGVSKTAVAEKAAQSEG